MIHPKEEVALDFAYHSEEFRILLDEAFRNASSLRYRLDRSAYVRTLLRGFSRSLESSRFSQIRIRPLLQEVPWKPIVRMKGKSDESYRCVLADLVVVMRFSSNQKVHSESVVLYSFLSPQEEGELWHVPLRQVSLLSEFPPFEFGTRGGKPTLFTLEAKDRFTGSFWFVNRHQGDFILSALGLKKTGDTVIRLSEVQGRFRFHSDVALVRQALGRFGDDTKTSPEFAALLAALKRFMAGDSEPPAEFQDYAIQKRGHPFFMLELHISSKATEK